jgi:hypothetical protein
LLFLPYNLLNQLNNFMKKIILVILITLSIKVVSQSGYVTMTGGTDHISVIDTSLWDFQGDFTFSMKVKFTNPSSCNMLLTHHDGTVPQGWELSFTGSSIRLSPEGYTIAVDAPWSPLANTWYHLVVTREMNTINVYIDGNSINTTAFSGVLGSDDFPLMIGNYYYPGYAFFGEMDDVSIWNLGSSQSIVSSVLSSTLTGAESGLLAYYDMNDIGVGQGIVAINKAQSTGVALNGMTVGSATTPYFSNIATNIYGITKTDEEVTLYPNPFSSSTTLRLSSDNFVHSELFITDLLGKQVKVLPVNEQEITINRDELESGVYFYSLKNENGKILNGKIIVEY